MPTELIYGIIGALVIVWSVIYFPGRLCLYLYKTLVDNRPTLKERIICFAPIYNLQLMREILYAEAPVYRALSIMSALYTALFIIIRFVIGYSSTVGILLNLGLSVFTMCVAIPTVYIFGYRIIWDIGAEFDAITLRAYGLFTPVGFYYAVGRIQRYFKNHPEQLEGIFDEV